jgi:hypothetical protein
MPPSYANVINRATVMGFGPRRKNVFTPPPPTARAERLKSSHLIVMSNSQLRSNLGLVKKGEFVLSTNNNTTEKRYKTYVA